MMIRVGLFGAGRIGAVHADNLSRSRSARLTWVMDPDARAAEALAARHGAQAAVEARSILGDPAVDAVIVASPTSTHVELIVAAARAGKAIFCEKPIDLELARVDHAIAEVERAGVPFFVAFNRRFDPSFARLKEELATGSIGKIEQLIITSRDPAPPPARYIASSGGLFRDMMIHDFDMARWLLGEEPVEVYAMGSVLVDPQIGEQGDVDTAQVVMRTQSGALCHISNSRRAAYGYDQRVEVFGEGGMLIAENRRESTVVRYLAGGVVADKPPHFFLERYAEAYRAELEHFLAAVSDPDQPLLVGPHDGRQALVLAEAALESTRTKKPVQLRAPRLG